jgi:hypothetical protein
LPQQAAPTGASVEDQPPPQPALPAAFPARVGEDSNQLVANRSVGATAGLLAPVSGLPSASGTPSTSPVSRQLTAYLTDTLAMAMSK